MIFSFQSEVIWRTTRDHSGIYFADQKGNIR